MNARILAAAVILAALGVGALFYVGSRPADPGPEASAATAPAAAPREGAGAPAPEPAVEAPRAVRRAPSTEPDVEPAPEVTEAAPELGTLRIDADVTGAQVFIDRRFVGTTPLTAEDVSPGTHQVNVTAEGFDGIAQTIDVEPGPRDLTFRFREVRLDAALAVVHRHRIGSCRGQLVATPDGIRYETSDTEDAFSAPLSELETFQVDYQEKNLRIRIRKGRQYNFTDPDGNADRLFVFHRDVERARARMTQ